MIFSDPFAAKNDATLAASWLHQAAVYRVAKSVILATSISVVPSALPDARPPPPRADDRRWEEHSLFAAELVADPPVENGEAELLDSRDAVPCDTAARLRTTPARRAAPARSWAVR